MSDTKKPYIIGIAGGTASGKTTMAKTIIEKVGSNKVAYINHDYYYKDLSHLQLPERLQINFDHPDSLETSLLIKDLKQLIEGHTIYAPQYDFKICTRLDQTLKINPLDIIIVDGILSLVDEELRDLYDFKIFVELNADERILRRIERDVKERGRTIDSVVNQYRSTVRPMHDQYVKPSKVFADIVVPGGASKSAALEALAGQVLGKIELARRRAGFEILQEIASSTAEEYPRSLLSTIVQIAAKELSADNVTIHLYDKSQGGFLDPSKYSATWPIGGKLQIPRKDGISAQVINQGLINISDITKESDQSSLLTTRLIETNTKAILGIRLEAAGDYLGVLFFNYLKPRLIGLDEENLANMLGIYAAMAIHRNRLYDQRTIQKKKFSRLSKIGKKLLSTKYDVVKDEIVKFAAEEMFADDVTLHQFDESIEGFLDPEIYSATWPSNSKLEKPRHNGVSAYVIKIGSISISDVEGDIDQRLVSTSHLIETGIKAFIGSRLEVEGETVGVLFFNYKKPQSFESEQIDLSNIIANYAAISIYKSRLFEQVQQLSSRLKGLSEIGKIILLAEFASVKLEIVRFIANQFEADNVTLHQYDNYKKEFLEPTIHSATWPPGGKLQLPRKSGASSFVLEHGTIMIPNVSTEPKQELVQTEYLIEKSTGAFIGIRLEAGDEIIGILFINFLTPQRFGANEQALVRVLSVYTSAAILTAWAYKRRIAEKQAENLLIVREIANALEIHTELDAFLFSLLELSLSRLNATKGSIQLLKGDTLILHAAVGLEYEKDEAIISIDDGITGLAIRDNKFIYEPDTNTNPDFLPYLGDMRSEMAVPLAVGDRVLGVFNVEQADPFAFSEDQQDLFKLIAGQVAIVIHQKLSLDNEISKRKIIEQQALLLDIAFDYQHHIRNKVGAARIRTIQLLDDQNLDLTEDQRYKLVIIKNNTEAALKASKHILDIYKPPSQEWITPKILIDEMLELIDIVPEVELHVEFPSDLPMVFVEKDRTEYALKDIITNAQRAILNSERRTGKIEITGDLTDDKRYVEIQFSNDGPPIPKSEWNKVFKGPGFGLPTAKTLLQNQSGDIELLESNDKRTSFIVRIPTIITLKND